MTEALFDITVVIPTRNRSASLCVTLESLAVARRDGLAVQVVVVDNGSNDDTRAVVQKPFGGLFIRYSCEPSRGEYGKCHALNRALSLNSLGELIVILDDDMSVERGWWQGIVAISRRHPEADLFTGRSEIIWPAGPRPAWVADPRLRGWLFSVRWGDSVDRHLAPGQWFSGNFFWFRSRVLADGRRFLDTWLTEPQFMLRLVEDGYRAVQGPDAQVGHRIQPELLKPEIALKRAAHSGKMFAQSRLVPFRRSVPNARRAAEHPILARAYCAATAGAWTLRHWQVRKVAQDSAQFAATLIATHRLAACREALRILINEEPYRLFRRVPGGKQQVSHAAGSSRLP